MRRVMSKRRPAFLSMSRRVTRLRIRSTSASSCSSSRTQAFGGGRGGASFAFPWGHFGTVKLSLVS